MGKDQKRIAVHENGCRLYAEDVAYGVLSSLEEARIANDTVAVPESDVGGQTYVTAPIGLVQCSEESLHRRLADIDVNERNERDGNRIFYERHVIGGRIRAE